MPVIALESQSLRLEALASAGPRIVTLSFRGSPNLLADVPHLYQPTPWGEFYFRGGHRLWHAPEVMPGTYVPDNDEPSITVLPGRLVLEGRPEPDTGIRKQMDIRLDPDRPAVTLVHTLFNDGPAELVLAPWAITMLCLGGTAVLPTRLSPPELTGLLPDRRIIAWPYTRLDDPRLTLLDDFILIHGGSDWSPLKVGAFSPAGWIACWLEGVLFRKCFEVHPGAPYPDFGCSAEVFTGQGMLEIESLAPLVSIPPHAFASHTESWEFYDSPCQDFLPSHIQDHLKG